MRSIGSWPLAKICANDGIAPAYFSTRPFIFILIYIGGFHSFCSKKRKRSVFSKNMRRKANVIMYLLMCPVRSRSCAHFFGYITFFPPSVSISNIYRNLFKTKKKWLTFGLVRPLSINKRGELNPYQFFCAL